MKHKHSAVKLKDFPSTLPPMSMPPYEDDYRRGGGKPLEEYGVYMLVGEINTYTTSNAIRYILEANMNAEYYQWEYLTMIINSEGGYTTDGFALIDTMFGSCIPIRTVGIGLIASMGLQIFLAGEKGSRTLTPNTMILSHQYNGGAYGKEHELVAAQKEQEHQTEIITKHYKRTTGLTETKIRELLLPPHDVWLTATEAKKYGICDIVKDVKPLQIKKNKTK